MLDNRPAGTAVRAAPASLPPRPSTDGADRPAGAASGLYRMVWRWHFFAGLLAIPVIVLLCLSGIVWLMRPEITWLLHRDAMSVTPAAASLTYQSQLAAVAERYPGSTPYQLGTPTGPSAATMVNITTAAGRDLTVWVDPYRGRVTGTRDNGTDVTQIALKLHGSLMTASWLGNATWGDRLIEIVAGWTLLLILTGLYLFWPRTRRRGRWRRAFTPRLRSRSTNRRIAWRDVHAITGVLFAFATLFFVVTGMFWTGWWGVRYGEVTTRAGASYPAGMWDGAESRTADSLKRTGKGGWLSTNAPVFPSGRSATGGSSADSQPGQSNHVGHHHDATVSWEPGTAAPVDAVVGTAQHLGYPRGFSLTFPDSGTGSWAAWYGPDSDPNPNVSATQERMLYIDQYTAAPIRDFRFSQYGPAAQASDLGISIHEGRELGWITKIAMLLATLAILLSCATSLVMWRKRRPKGVGAPRRTGFARRRDAIAVFVIVAALGTLFPLLGASLLVVIAVDLLLVRRLPPLRRALAA